MLRQESDLVYVVAVVAACAHGEPYRSLLENWKRLVRAKLQEPYAKVARCGGLWPS